jgi:hypothetical protein
MTAVVLVLAAIGGAPLFDVSRHTIDSGGVMHSTGGDFELSGTIGQPDAGRLSGGIFALTGGFWFEVVSSDCNEDGVVDLVEYDAFEPCLTGPGGNAPPTACACYDLDDDGVITLADFATVQDMFNGH